MTAVRVAGQVLAERRKGGVLWQARVSADRNRLEVLGVVAPSDTETLVAPLTEDELRDLLEGQAAPPLLREHHLAPFPKGPALMAGKPIVAGPRVRHACRRYLEDRELGALAGRRLRGLQFSSQAADHVRGGLVLARSTISHRR